MDRDLHLERVHIGCQPRVAGDTGLTATGQPEVIALSALLNALPIHARHPDARRCRNPAGVAMKLNNFLGLDPAYQGKGLSHCAKAVKEVCDELSSDRERLHAAAEGIRSFLGVPQADSASSSDEEYSAPEGEILL